MSVALMVVLALLYGVVHSWLANQGVKNWARGAFGPRSDRWYRLAYNAISVMALGPLALLLLAIPDHILYTLPSPWLWLAVSAQMVALAGAAYCASLTDGLHFLGLRQMAQPEPGACTRRILVLAGPYRWVRHPIYLFGLIFMWLTPQMTVNRLALFTVLSLYIYVATQFEERRLAQEFGAAYLLYQQCVPRLVPTPFSHCQPDRLPSSP
jgi:protein-S-isoprenylcysteine O-methyltransferase Ste14